ncbi:c-type cytochrome [Thalassolituus sp. LLYu03]|uniref:c-type cytochrome n=1 Tax=Thalassolituus sp. LLYu03 TaxID=3421656 RepID=UPI003D29F55D
MKTITRLGLAATLIAIGSSAMAAPKPFEAVEYRKGIFKAVKWNFGPMGDMVKGKTEFNADDFARRAGNLAALSKMPLEGFMPGTYERSTSALPVIEDAWDTFAKTMGDFETNSAALAEAAKGGDMNAIRPAFMKVAQTCKACHDKFKD